MARLFKIQSTAVYLPGNPIGHLEFDAMFSVNNSFTQTGIEERYLANSETAAYMSYQALNRALQKAHLNIDDIDCLISASATPDKALPYNAAMVLAEHKEPLNHIASFDVNVSCLSFLRALEIATLLLQQKTYRKIAITSCDLSRYTLEFSNLSENGIFGDGASAIILSNDDKGDGQWFSFLNSKFITLNAGVDFCTINAGGSRFHNNPYAQKNQYRDHFKMQGRQVLHLAAKELPTFIQQALEPIQMQISDIDFWVPHQASHRGLQIVFARLGVPPNRWLNI